MKIIYPGHACVALQGSKCVLIDPFIPGGEISVKPDLVAVTHAHADHMGIAATYSVPIITNNEIAHYLQGKGCNTEAMNIGGTIVVDGITFTMTQALHSSWIEDEGIGMYGGTAAGFVIRMDGVTVYHAGDTGLFSDMRLIGELYHPDVALIPIGGRFTMGPREGMMAAEFIGAPVVIPIHYNTFDKIRQDVSEFARAINETTDIKAVIVEPGEEYEISG
ncbi:metal-dependent hydrolase [Methanospirillum sp.]|uniref:metal-dependent hydrolase n=1 Tax=Methanospirillum sp. TaxID=45200 RepID=UPI00359FA1FA